MIKRRTAFGIYFITLALINAAALFWPYGFHNDYRVFEHPDWFFHPETPHLLAIGRPLGALLLELQTLSITGMNGLIAYRVLSIVMVAAFAALLFGHIREKFLVRDSEALAFSFAVVLLPSMQINILWVANSVPGIVSVLFAFASYRLFSDRRLWPAITFAASSLLIYHAGFLFFSVLTLLSLVLPPRDKENQVPQVLWEVAFVVAACVVYMVFTLLVWKFFLVTFGPSYFSGYYKHLANTQYSLGLGWDIRPKVHQIVDMIGMTGSLWLASASVAGVAVAVLCIVTTAILIGWRSALLMLVLLGLISSPIITAPVSFEVPYRTIFPQGAALLALCFSIYLWMPGTKMRLAGMGIVGILAVSSVLTVGRAQSLVANAAHEFLTIKTAILEQWPAGDGQIVMNVRAAPAGQEYYDRLLDRDFRLLSASDFAPMAGLAYAAAADLGIDPKRVDVRYFKSDSKLPTASDAIDVVMRSVPVPLNGPARLTRCDLVRDEACDIDVENLSPMEGERKLAPWRWGTAPGTKLKFVVSAVQAFRIHVSAQNPFPVETETELRLNGDRVTLIKLGAGEMLDVIVSLQAKAGPNDVEFVYSEWNHKSTGTPDPRLLAMPFRKLEIVGE